MVKLKICGMRRSEDIEMANRHKPDYIGFVFAESPRKVSFEQAKELSALLSEDIEPKFNKKKIEEKRNTTTEFEFGKKNL